jgi:hypothetical protein
VEHQIRKNLILFVPGKMAAVLGSSIYGFAIGLYILAKTGSSLSFAITLLMSSLPRIFFGRWGNCRPLGSKKNHYYDRFRLCGLAHSHFFSIHLWHTKPLAFIHGYGRAYHFEYLLLCGGHIHYL